MVKGDRVEEAGGGEEEEVQVVISSQMVQIQNLALQLSYRTPAITSAPTSSYRHDDEFKTQKSHPIIETPPPHQLSCDNLPFLMNLLDMSDDLNAFPNRVLASNLLISLRSGLSVEFQ